MCSVFFVKVAVDIALDAYDDATIKLIAISSLAA
ncbi:hypothetical protein X744_16255 [Mesorhizobium sp. LNJC372A00]|nr:hypothetical protein X744_16255 [Mesorhizobium sp. LNJC372A00]